MRKTLLFSLVTGALFLTIGANAQSIIDNFDSYNPGPISDQAAHWTTWSGVPGSAEEGIVTDELFSSFDKSMLIAEGMTQDCILLLGNQSGGVYSVKWKVYIPANKTGYYNIQESETPAVAWNMDIFFNTGNLAPGMANVVLGETVSGSFTFNHDEWITIENVIDLNANTLELFRNDESVWTMPYAGNLGAINFFSIDANNRYYIDDVEFTTITPIEIPANDTCSTAMDINPGMYDFTTVGAGTDGPDQPGSTCDAFGSSAIANDIWYTYTASCDGMASVSTCNTADFDTRIAIYSASDGCPVGAEGLLACNDDGIDATGTACLLFTSTVDWAVTADTSYLIRIGGFDATQFGGGSFSLTEDCGNAIGDIESSIINIYPNPVSNVANLDLSAASSDSHEVQIFDLTGKQLLSVVLNGKRIHTINTSSLNTGMYLISIKSDKSEKIQKLVVR